MIACKSPHRLQLVNADYTWFVYRMMKLLLLLRTLFLSSILSGSQKGVGFLLGESRAPLLIASTPYKTSFLVFQLFVFVKMPTTTAGNNNITVRWHPECDADFRAQYGGTFTIWIRNRPTHNVQVGGRNNWTQTDINFDEALVL